jgi:hypothetical protein
MSIQVFARPKFALLQCWGCSQQFRVDAEGVLSVDEMIRETIISARRDGWAVCRTGDEVFALCPGCVAVDLARLLKSLYDQRGGSRGDPDPHSVPGPDGARAPSGLWRRIRDILKFRREVQHGEEPEPVVWD